MIATYHTNATEFTPEEFAVPGSLTKLNQLAHRIRQSWDVGLLDAGLLDVGLLDVGLLIDETDSELLPEYTSNFLADGSADSLPDNGQAVEESRTAFLNPQAYRMRCECLQEHTLFDLVDHVFRVRQQIGAASTGDRAENRVPAKAAGPILIYVTDYQEAIEIDRCLESVKFRTHLASPFSNWTGILGKLGTGQLDVIISTTTEIPYADQIPWQAIYLPSALHLAMLTTPDLDWLGNYWFANHCDEQPPHLVVRRTRCVSA